MKILKILILLVSLFLLYSPGKCSEIKEESNMTQFILGNLHYKEGNYKEAIVAYERILQRGQESAALYYNLGNSYFKNGQLGKAILSYERARRLNPRDSDLQSNYQFALSQVKNYDIEAKRSFWSRLCQKYSRCFTRDEMAMILFSLYLLTGIIYLLNLFSRLSKGKMIALISLLIVLFVFHAIVFINKVSFQKDMAVVIQDTEAKFEPIEKSTTHFSLHEGHTVTLIREENKWFKVRRLDGRVGWILRNTVEKI